MAFNLTKANIETALKHLCKYGDTDVFPHLPELAFFRDEFGAVVAELEKLDLDSYNPGGALEALAPKSKYGFRIAHQSSAIDTLLFLTAAIEIGLDIEKLRPSVEGAEAFSYRFGPDINGSVFIPNRTFRDWLINQQNYINNNLKIKQIVATDISDFYARINFHRIENLLDESALNHGAARYIKKTIRIIRAKQSFGLPVGGTAARLLSELALSDIDKALIDHGIIATRFVDDFRIFLRSDESPYDVLSFLAEMLGINEGLALNAAKTRVYSRKSYLEKIKGQTSDIAEEAEGHALESLTSDVYFDEEPSEEDVESLKALNILSILQQEIGSEEYDFGKIKVIFRALKIVKPYEAIDFISSNLQELVVFAKEVTLLMQELHQDNQNCFDDVTDTLIDAIISPPASSVQIIRTWLLELLVRGIVPISNAQTKKLESLSSILDRRQLHLIRGRAANKSYFRLHKTKIGQFSAFEQPAFIAGASCLPKGEYEKWLPMLKAEFSGPTSHLYLKWVEKNKDNVFDKMSNLLDEHPE